MKTFSSSPTSILFLYGIVVKSVFGFSNNDEIVEWSESMEFGREAFQDDTSDADIKHRSHLLSYSDLFEEEMFVAMSMSMSFDYNAMEKPTALPTIEQDQPKVASLCGSDFQDVVSIPLEVDVAMGNTQFDPIRLESALQTTLTDEYTFCISPSRRRLEGSSALNQDIQLGSISLVEESDERCVPRLISADLCYVVRADFLVATALPVDGALATLQDSLKIIFDTDAFFTNELPLEGIIDVRVRLRVNGPANGSTSDFEEKSEQSLKSNSRTEVLAILSTAATAVIFAVVFRVIKSRNSAEQYSECGSQGSTISDSPMA